MVPADLGTQHRGDLVGTRDRPLGQLVEGLTGGLVQEVDPVGLAREVGVLVRHQLLRRVGRGQLGPAGDVDGTGEAQQGGQAVGVHHQHPVDLVAAHVGERAAVELADHLGHVGQVRRQGHVLEVGAHLEPAVASGVVGRAGHHPLGRAGLGVELRHPAGPAHGQAPVGGGELGPVPHEAVQSPGLGLGGEGHEVVAGAVAAEHPGSHRHRLLGHLGLRDGLSHVVRKSSTAPCVRDPPARVSARRRGGWRPATGPG